MKLAAPYLAGKHASRNGQRSGSDYSTKKGLANRPQLIRARAVDNILQRMSPAGSDDWTQEVNYGLFQEF